MSSDSRCWSTDGRPRLKKSLEKEQSDIRKECQDMMHQLDQLVDEVRRLARDLSPTMVRDSGLSSALKRLIEEFTRHFDVHTDFHQIEGMDRLSGKRRSTSTGSSRSA